MRTEDEIETPGHLPDLGEVGRPVSTKADRLAESPLQISPEHCRFPVISFVVSAFTLENLS